MLWYWRTRLYPNSIYMIVINVLDSARRKLSMKLQPHLPVQCDCSPPFPHPFLPFLMPPSFPSPFLLPPLPSSPPSLPSPCLALPLPLSFLWIASLLIAYALPCLSYLLPPPSSLTCSFHIFGGDMLELAM